MRASRLLILALVGLAGCGSSRGNGSWDLRVGAVARLVSADGSEITLESLSAGSTAKAGKRGPRAALAVTKSVAPGTRAVILAVDGDDARVEIKEGSLAGTVHWVPCDRLDQEDP
jgi:hypothetical protein